MTARSKISAETPLETRPPEVKPQPHEGGGLGAIFASMKYAHEELGVARSVKTLLLLNQAKGFDCPGCAWPEPDPAHRAAFEFCENGAKAVAEEATLARLTPEIFSNTSIEDLSKETDHALGKLGRITHPMLKNKGDSHFRAVSWEDAFALVARELHALSSPDEATFYTSGRTSNEAAFLYQLFVRQFGTNNLPDCSNMCHESSGTGLDESIGVGKGTVQLEDFALADAIFIVGQNPGTNHPRMLTTLGEASARGAMIVSVNPLAEAALTAFRHPQDAPAMFGPPPPIAKMHVRVKVNGDVALFQGLAKEMLDAEERAPGTVIDQSFVNDKTTGFEAYRDAIKNTLWSEIEEGSGVSRDVIKSAARVLIESKRTIICWAMGITQHRNGVANVQEIVNVQLLRGQVGRPGAGVCPVRGHSNVQGDRTMGVWEKMPDPFLDKLGAEFSFAPPRKHGFDVVQSIRAMRDGNVRVFLSMGGNFLSAAPDTRETARALAKCTFAASVSTKLNRTHLVAGETSLILPCLGRSELDLHEKKAQFVTVEDSMSLVHASHGALDPSSPHLKSEVAIICGIAAATLGKKSIVEWSELSRDYDLIRDHISRVVPGFADFNVRVRHKAGFLLPNAARDGEFNTHTKKANFIVHAMPQLDVRKGELVMMTIRSHDQYNTTIYGLNDRYRGIKNGRRVVFMSEKDIAARDLAKDDLVDITSRDVGVDGERERVAKAFFVVPYDIPDGSCATYYPEANVLVPLDAVAVKSGTPASKSVIVSIKKHVVAIEAESTR